MGFIVTLSDYAPPARSDGRRFTEAVIEEAVAAIGDWAEIDTLTLPAEGSEYEPANPEARTLTTRKATLQEGFYRIVWVDEESNRSSPTAPVENASELAGGIRPTIAEVASLLRARTKVKGGKELGTFSFATRPTSLEVDELIDEAMDEVLGKVVEPEEPGSGYERRIRGAVRLYTAILIEGSYFPEQVKSGQSVAQTYQALYSSRIKALIAESKTGKPEGEGDDESPPDAAWSFPENNGGLFGWSTRV